MKDCNDTREIERILLHSIEYIAEIHNKNMFHGDIKPANIFYNEYINISSDSGSLVLLEKDYMNYYIKVFTPAFSSEKHKHAILNKAGETKEELFNEDKH